MSDTKTEKKTPTIEEALTEAGLPEGLIGHLPKSLLQELGEAMAGDGADIVVVKMSTIGGNHKHAEFVLANAPGNDPEHNWTVNGLNNLSIMLLMAAKYVAHSPAAWDRFYRYVMAECRKADAVAEAEGIADKDREPVSALFADLDPSLFMAMIRSFAITEDDDKS